MYNFTYICIILLNRNNYSIHVTNKIATNINQGKFRILGYLCSVVLIIGDDSNDSCVITVS